jgi:CubicO group peptidase (beta-lactamase class C family)
VLDQTYADGFLVIYEGRIVTEQYFYGLRPDTSHLLMSVSKSVTGLVAGVLAGQLTGIPMFPRTAS